MSTEHPPRTTLARTGAETRRQVQQVALDLFTAQGYEATSLRQIAEALGINKASLYYHFASKEAILRSLFAARGDEAQELLDWLHDQPRTPELLETAVLRWVGSFSVDKLRGIRFISANPLVARAGNEADGDRIGTSLERLVEELGALVPAPTAEKALLLRMSVLSINAAVHAAAGAGTSDEAIVAAARTAATALLREVSSGRPDH